MEPIEIFSQLPEDLKIEIFTRVPPESVGRFRCSSRRWKNILSSPYFLNLHLSRDTHPQSVILTTPYSSLQIINSPIQNPAESKQFLLDNVGRWTDVIGSVHGLVVLMNSRKEMVLTNPVTREQLKIPKIHFGPNFLFALSLYGFGYDSSSLDYKILLAIGLISSADTDFSFSVDLYSVKSAVWRSIHHSPYILTTMSQAPRAVYANGSFYWYGCHKTDGLELSKKIPAFDLATEGFHEVDSPSESEASQGVLRLFAHEGHLWALNSIRTFMGVNGKIEFWMMMGNFWTKLVTVGGNMNSFVYLPFYFARDETVMLAATERSMVVFNRREGTIRNFVVDGVTTFSRDGCSFVGSLVSIRGIV